MKYAGFFARFFALCIDSFIVWLVCAFFLRSMFTAPIGVVISLLYFIVFETSDLRATPGKWFMGIAITQTNGDKMDLKHALIRFFSIWITRLTACIGYIIALFTERKQALHDFIADTIVVEGTFSDLNLWDAWIKQFRVLVSDIKNPEDKNINPHTSLEELYNLFQKGILTEEEYKSKKEEYLKRL